MLFHVLCNKTLIINIFSFIDSYEITYTVSEKKNWTLFHLSITFTNTVRF